MSNKTAPLSLTWKPARFEEGPFKGRFWGAEFRDAFFMIVPKPTTKGRFLFEVWSDGFVHDECQHRTLAEAKAFAEALAKAA